MSLYIKTGYDWAYGIIIIVGDTEETIFLGDTRGGGAVVIEF